jgi:hypothetical protein
MLCNASLHAASVEDCCKKAMSEVVKDPIAVRESANARILVYLWVAISTLELRPSAQG